MNVAKKKTVLERSVNQFIKLILFFIFSSLNSYANKGEVIHHISLSEGLNSTDIRCITQDQKGFIWLGTWGGGLLRYDGYEFIAFKHDEKNQSSISDDYVDDILIDHSGCMWIGTNEGLDCFNPLNQKFTHFKTDYRHAIRLAMTDTNTIAVAYYGGMLGLFDVNYRTFKYLKRFSNSHLPNLVKYNGNNVVAGFRGDFLKMINSKTFKEDSVSLFNHQVSVWSLLPMKDKIIIGSWDDGLYIREPDKLIHYTTGSSLPDNRITSLFSYNDDVLWIGTNNGLIAYQFSTGRFFAPLKDMEKLSGLCINRIFRSKEGMMWICTKQAGIFIINSEHDPFQFIESRNTEQKREDIITSVFIDSQQRLWMGTGDGHIIIKDAASQKRIALKESAGEYKAVTIESLAENEDHNILAATDGNGLFMIDHSFNVKKLKTGGNNYFSSLAKRKDRIYFAAISQVGFIDKNLQQHILTSVPDSNILIFSLWIDPEQNIWIGCADNLCYLKAGEKNTPVKIFPFNVSIYSMHGDSSFLWLATNRGVIRMNIKTKDFVYIRNSSEAKSEMVYSITGDPRGRIWYGSSAGLISYSPQQKSFSVYGFSALKGLQQFYRSSCIASGKKLYFGGLGGALTFDADSLSYNHIVPNIGFTTLNIMGKYISPGVSYNGEIILQNDLNYVREMVFYPAHKSFTLSFSALHYKNPEGNQYAYRLINFDSSWISVSSRQRFVSYTNLDPGIYHLQIKASNGDGIWNTTPTELKIVIKPPFWKTWWFRISLSILIVLIILGYIRYRTQSLEKRNLILEETVKDRTKEILAQKEELEQQTEALRETNIRINDQKKEIENQSAALQSLNQTKDKLFSIIAHDLRNPFHSIGMMTDVLLKDDNDHLQRAEMLGAIKNSSESASMLLNNLLEWARSQTGSLDIRSANINVKEIFNEILALITLQAQNKQITIENFVLKDFWGYADRNMIATAFRNILSNCIKFSPAGGTVKISARDNENEIIVTITDNGVGMSREQVHQIMNDGNFTSTYGTQGEKGTGLGLKVTRDFILKNKGRFLVESTEGKGSAFTIVLPAGTAEKTETPVKQIKEVKPETPNEPEKTKAQLYEILIVDDEQPILEAMKKNLSAQFIIRTASQGKEALALAIKHIPDLIVSDVMMPGMDGIALCSAIKADEKTSHIPVILFTANDQEEQHLKGIRTGADDYIQKPCNIRILEAKIHAIIENRNKLRSLFSRQMVLQTTGNIINTTEQKFIENVMAKIEANLDNGEFGVDELAREIGLSRAQLYRKLNAITDETPVEFIRNYRLRKAEQMLKQGGNRVSDVAYQVGFKDLSHFRKCFKAYFGKPASEV